jgi:S-adenosylmethionine:tRNA ribosyltransferase-isomerase
MDVKLFDYHLPPELIAQEPLHRRADSRLLVLERRSGTLEHRRFADLVDLLQPGDGLVVNNTKVLRARLWGHRKTGGKIEIFLVRRSNLERCNADLWEALVSPSRRLHPEEEIHFDETHAVRLIEYLDNGRWVIDFGSVSKRRVILSRFGHVPLPPYIHREDGALDQRRYQTVFANAHREGAVAAPTAGLHFTNELLTKIRRKGISVIELTLHVGPGTFKPIKVDRIEDHRVDPEFVEVSQSAAEQINAVRKRGGSIVAVGTTSVRSLESAPLKGDQLESFSGMVDLFIKPGFAFRVVDHLVTNFHLPKSSLLVLVSAMAGRELVLEAYREAVQREYRFYSYGDAMYIV